MACTTQIAEDILGQMSHLPLEDQNEVLETMTRKMIIVRDQQAYSLEQKAAQLRSSTHDLKTRLTHLNNK